MATALLASPMFTSYSPQRPSDEHIQYRPAKNMEAFNSLLPPVVEFVEGSSTGALAVAEGKYEPINGSPKASRAPVEVKGKPRTSLPSLSSSKVPAGPPQASATSLYTRPIDATWPSNVDVGTGFFNTGNTCFLNSALQCLLHTAPLLRVLHAHKDSDPCRVKNNQFCMTCSLRQVMVESFKRTHAFTPQAITKNVQIIAKHMRKGRQEDSHEFLRYAIDALQKSCLAGHPPKIDPKIAETTWVHKIFGGRLRSRVTCTQCGHNSDTFDNMLDLSIDIYGVTGLKEALRKFTAIDHLKGADKYKCEKCKRAVNAEKSFTIHDAPLVLTVHLKRFTPMGRKLAHPIRYDERLSLQPSMSDGQFGPTYSLYGVISHAGGGPNSGHYYAHVKSASGQWYEMNDDSVERLRGAPMGMKNAYILFYVREKGQSLEAALNGRAPVGPRNGALMNGASKKRKVVLSDDEDDEDKGEKTAKPFIGPTLPPVAKVSAGVQNMPNGKLNGVHPQTEVLKKKIEAMKSKQMEDVAKKALVDYPDEEEEEGEVAEPAAMPTSSAAQNGTSSPALPPTSPLPMSSSPPNNSIASSSFYGATPTPVRDNARKRKSPDGNTQGMDDSMSVDKDSRTHSENNTPQAQPSKRSHNGSDGGSTSRSSLSGNGAGNPYNRMKGSNNFESKREDLLFRPRKLQKSYGKSKRKMLM